MNTKSIEKCMLIASFVCFLMINGCHSSTFLTPPIVHPGKHIHHSNKISTIMWIDIKELWFHCRSSVQMKWIEGTLIVTFGLIWHWEWFECYLQYEFVLLTGYPGQCFEPTRAMALAPGQSIDIPRVCVRLTCLKDLRFSGVGWVIFERKYCYSHRISFIYSFVVVLFVNLQMWFWRISRSEL